MAVVQETVKPDKLNLCEDELSTLLQNTGEILLSDSDYKHGASAKFGDKRSVHIVGIQLSNVTFSHK
jgi:hypothetical protein